MRPSDPDAPTCVCGCPAETHVHNRPGTDCGRCGNRVCEVYRPHNRRPWRHPPDSPIMDVFEIEGWVAFGSPSRTVRPG
jgi:hypothetical protein